MDKLSYTFKDMYKTMPIDVDYATYTRVLDEMVVTILKSILNASEGFKMPYGLGYIQIVKYEPKNLTEKSLSVDYKSSRELGKRIYHLNEHSDGCKFRLYWSKIPKTFPERYKYQLQMVRKNKRALAKLIFNKQDYINIDDIQLYKM